MPCIRGSGAAFLSRSVSLLFVLAASSPCRAEKPDIQTQARVHFQKGMAAFELGRFQEALVEYQRAYAVAPLPGFLFNIGQCHRNLGNFQKAVFFFRLYLRKKPEARNREAVLILIRELEVKLEEERQKRARIQPRVPDPRLVPVYPPPPPPPPPAPFYKKWWFWTSIAAAVVGGTVGIYFAARTQPAALPDSDFPIMDVKPSR
jgi:hypothetical protein